MELNSVFSAISIAIFILRYLASKFSTFNYYLKWFMCIAWCMTWSAIYIPYFLLRPRNVSNLTDASHILKLSSVLTGTKITFRGREVLEKDDSCLIVANHQSILDHVGMFAIWKDLGKATVIAKRELLCYGSFGIAGSLGGLTFINRAAGLTARQAVNDAMLQLKEKKVKLWVFPEGTRRNTREIHEFKKGAFHAAIHAQVPIVPVVFSSISHFLDGEKKIFNSGEIIITALPEIPTEGLTIEAVDDLIKRARTVMTGTYNATSSETEKASKF